MSSNNKHFKYIDILRIFSCIMIFLYHLNMLKGGFLAVSIFFVISGYLSTIKLFKKEKISFKEFYLNNYFSHAINLNTIKIEAILNSKKLY